MFNPWDPTYGGFYSHDRLCYLAQLILVSMFQMFKLVLKKAEEPEIKLSTSAGSSKKQKSSRKASISALLTMPKRLTVWITINCGKNQLYFNKKKKKHETLGKTLWMFSWALITWSKF